MKTPSIPKYAKSNAFPRLALALIAFVAAQAGELTEAEKAEGLAHLARTRAGVVEATKGLSEAQWRFKPGPDRWSVAEILEHIALSEDMLFGHVSKKVMQAPAGKPDRDYRSADKLVLSAVPDRSRKAQAPEPLIPTGRKPPQEWLEQFLESRERTAEFLKSTPGLREHVVDSPLGRPLDAYQWLLFISAHTERHTKQMREVKADPNFPRGSGEWGPTEPSRDR